MEQKTYGEQLLMNSGERETYDKYNGLSSDLKSGGSTGTLSGAFEWKGLLLVVGLVFLYGFAMGFIDFVTEVPFSNPLFFFTNPLWLLLIVFFTKHFIPKLISVVFITISLPLFTALAYFMFSEAILYAMGVSSTIPLSGIIEVMYLSAYGTTFGIELQHFFIAEELGFYSDLEHFMWSLNIINGIILAVGFAFLYRFYFQVISTITRSNASFNENPFIGYLGNIFLMAFTYYCCMPLIYFTSELPYALNIIVVWSILLFPFLGIRLALTNMSRAKSGKNGQVFAYYYIAFFLSVISYSAYSDPSFVQLFSDIAKGDTTNINLNHFFLLSPLASFYWLIGSILKHKKG